MTQDSIEQQIERVLRADIARRDTGLEAALRRCEDAGEAVFLFGGDSATVHALRSRVRSSFPRLRVAGICDADFAGPAGHAILAHIAACKPDMVIVDMSPKRHRALIAEFAANGLHMGLTNLPGTFERYVAARRHGGLTAAGRSPRLPRPIGKAMSGFAAALRFSGIIAHQFVRDAGPRPASQAYSAGRRDG